MLCQNVLKISDNLSRTLQKSLLFAAEAQHHASLTVATLGKMCTAESFRAFFDLVECSRNLFKVEDPSLPRRKQFPEGLKMKFW